MITQSRTTSCVLFFASVTTCVLWTMAAKQAFSGCPQMAKHMKACDPGVAGWLQCSGMTQASCDPKANNQHGLDPVNGNWDCQSVSTNTQCLTGITPDDDTVCYKEYTCKWDPTTNKCTNNLHLSDHVRTQQVTSACN